MFCAASLQTCLLCAWAFLHGSKGMQRAAGSVFVVLQHPQTDAPTSICRPTDMQAPERSFCHALLMISGSLPAAMCQHESYRGEREEPNRNRARGSRRVTQRAGSAARTQSVRLWAEPVHRHVSGCAGYAHHHAVQLLGRQYLAAQPRPAQGESGVERQRRALGGWEVGTLTEWKEGRG